LPLRFKSILLEFDRASLGPTLSAADSSSSLDSVSTFKEPITNRYCPQRFTEAGAKVGFIHTISEDDRQKTFQLPIYLLKRKSRIRECEGSFVGGINQNAWEKTGK
jgi:hypothetical protein